MISGVLSRRKLLLGSVSTIAALSLWPGSPVEAAPVQTDVPRRILALYDGAIASHLRLTSIHRLAAMPLEWLGLTLEYHDIHQGFPPIWNDPSFRGVLSWFPEPNLPNFDGYVSWIERIATAGLKVVQIDDAGPKPGSSQHGDIGTLRRRLFSTFGVRSLGFWSGVTLGDEIVQRDKATTEFETRFDAGLPPYELYTPLRADVESWLVVARADQARSQSHLVMVSPAGGFIAPGYAFGVDPQTGVRQWYIDPFAFFAAAFALDDLPSADTTTLCGRRIYYSHVDGDGWRSISQVRAFGQPRATNAEIVLQSVVAAHPDLPVTVAPIAAEMDPGFAGDFRALSAARGFFRLSHVEAATHTYTHPFRWAFFENYTVASEAPFQNDYRSAVSGRSAIVDLSDQAAGLPGCCRAASRNEKSPPRAFGGRPFDLSQEVTGAAKLIDAIGAASGKSVRLLQWPGDCVPFPAALRCVADAGLLNINGGDTRCDQEYPSITAIAPLGFQRNGLIQVYASNSSEERYTDLWTDRFFGFRDLVQTWDRTGSPRRLKPFNLYYHMYSGERRASLDALLENIAALRERGDYIGIFASDFAALAQGFFTVSFQRRGSAGWLVRERGQLQTIRFPGADERMVDLDASHGVLGERASQGQLYVSLDPAVAEPLIILTKRSPAPSKQPLLVQSSWRVSGLALKADRFSFAAEGCGPGDITWRVVPNQRWTMQAGENKTELKADGDGLLQLDIPGVGPSSVRVAMTRATA